MVLKKTFNITFNIFCWTCNVFSFRKHIEDINLTTAKQVECTLIFWAFNLQPVIAAGVRRMASFYRQNERSRYQQCFLNLQQHSKNFIYFCQVNSLWTVYKEYVCFKYIETHDCCVALADCTCNTETVQSCEVS